MYYYTTSTLDINPETASVNPDAQVITPVIYTSTSTSGSIMDWAASYSTEKPSPSEVTSPLTSISTPKLTTAARIAALERLIQENNEAAHLRRVDMAHILGVGLSRIKDDLRLLAAQGKVVFVGAGSHSGHWHLEGNPETEAEVEQWLSTPGYTLLHGSRGRYATTSTPKFPLLHRQTPTSTPKFPLLQTSIPTSTPRDTMSPESKALAVVHTAVNCALAVVQTPYTHKRDIYCAPYRWHTPFYFTRQLWREALSPLQPLLSRG